MNDQETNLNTKFTRHTNFNSDTNKSQKSANGPSGHYSYERGTKHVKRLRLFLRDGRILSMPYALLPIIVFRPGKYLRLITGDFEISITGRSLGLLEEYLSSEKVNWIKESPSGIDDEKLDVFITNIAIEGDLNM